MPVSPLTHFNPQGKAQMVDIGAKVESHRVARAAGHISMRPETLNVVLQGSASKGDVLGVARIAAIQGCALAMWLDARTVNGISVWIKPAKFFASLALYYATLAWMFGLLPRETQSTRSGRTIIGLAVAAGAYEMTWLVAAAVAGVPSHFNRTHWAWATAYNLAGLGATLLLVAVWMQGRLIARDRQVPLHPAFRLSLVISARLAFVATLITAGVLASGNGHWLGAAVANDAAGRPVQAAFLSSPHVPFSALFRPFCPFSAPGRRS